jgi:small subunit ribosomal protein S14
MARKALRISTQRLQKEFEAKGKKMDKWVRVYNRCKLCGRARGYLRFFQVCRICFRENANQGLVMGVKKSSW